jgi:hypothetical protein
MSGDGGAVTVTGWFQVKVMVPDVDPAAVTFSRRAGPEAAR